METEHLRKDDLVYYDGKPVKLNDLWQDFLQGLQTKGTENHQGKHVIWDLRSEKLAPIEISEDILLKSDFKKSTSYDDEQFQYSKEDSEYYCCVKIRPQRGGWFVYAKRFNIGKNSKYFFREFEGNIKYVHQLQLILTALGIDKEIVV